MNSLNLIAVLLLALAGASAQTQGEHLYCVTPGDPSSNQNGVEPGSKEEVARMSQAPKGAKRPSKHRLTVNWTGGQRVFNDERPYDEGLDGLWWTYCGYNPRLKLHLVGNGKHGVFTGVLVDHEHGTLLPGGESVLFSPDGQQYLSYEQPDGQDGETLKLYSRNGRLLWKGYNGILSGDGKSVVVGSEHMKNMHWDKQNRPQATAVLDSGKQQTITLTVTKNGRREWLPGLGK